MVILCFSSPCCLGHCLWRLVDAAMLLRRRNYQKGWLGVLFFFFFINTIIYHQI